jgi:hypothetical protein
LEVQVAERARLGVVEMNSMTNGNRKRSRVWLQKTPIGIRMGEKGLNVGSLGYDTIQESFETRVNEMGAN